MALNSVSQVLRHLRRSALQRSADSATDGQLLTLFAERRDEHAFAALVERHAPMVWGVCRRVLGDDHEAEDAFQATFLVLVRKAASVLPRERVANWLYGVAHTTALRARSLSARRRAREKQVTAMPEPETRPSDSWDDLRPLLDAELARLPDKYRVTVVLCDLEERTIKEAAHQLGWPQGTVAGRLARARTMLARRLKQHGVALSGGALAALLSEQAAPAPAAMVSSTIQVALLSAAGRMASGVISAQAAALTEGVLQSMMLTKLKTLTAILVVTAASLTILGGGLATTSTSAAPQARDEKHANPPAESSKKETPQAGDPVHLVGFVDSGTVPQEDKPETAKTDLDRLQGVWSIVAIEKDGKPSKLEKGVFMVDGKRACVQGQDGELQGGLYLNATSQPRTFDLAMSKSTIEGIYALDKDTLRLCYGFGSEAKRPSRFATEQGDQRVLLVLKKVHGRTVSPYRLADGTRTFPTLVPGEQQPVPPPPAVLESQLPQAVATGVPDARPQPEPIAFDYGYKASAAERSEPTLPPAGFMPQQALVHLHKDLLVVRTLEVMYEPITMMQGRNRVTTYQKNELLKTRSFPADLVKVYDVKGKRVSRKQLGELLKKETVALVSVDERTADAHNLQLFKEGTLLFILPSLAPPAPAYAPPAVAPPYDAPAPVPAAPPPGVPAAPEPPATPVPPTVAPTPVPGP
jgi:RNA polymerase sigma factor (sigma-70 family)